MAADHTTHAAVVLMSGGIDSTTCVAFYLRQGFSVQGVFMDHGQAAAAQEEQAVTQIAEHYGLPLRTLMLRGSSPKADGLIVGRNAFLLFAALMELKQTPCLLAIGIHSNTDYYDCSLGFVAQVQQLFDNYTDGRVEVSAPFANWQKRDIWEFALANNVPLTLTYSCELGLQQPCGHCRSCRDLYELQTQ